MGTSFRPGTLDDSFSAFAIFQRTLLELEQRIGSAQPGAEPDQAGLEQSWKGYRLLFDHLARTAEHFWMAERGGEAIGYARSIRRDDVLILTDFFVLPGQQSAGVGRELLARAFPTNGAPRRALVGTADMRAVVRYLKERTYPRFPCYHFLREPEAVGEKTDLTFEPISHSAETLAALGDLDKAILGFRRETDHALLLEDRQGYLYYRDQQPVGYGYVGEMSGPFALLDEGDFPAVLAHAEREAASHNQPEVVFVIPMINRAAVEHLLGRGFQLDPFINYFMSESPMGKFENYVFTSPPLFP